MISDNARSGMQQAPARSLFNALGFTAEEMKKPMIGIVSSYNEIVPGHMNIDKIVNAVKLGVAEAGGVPVVLPQGILKAMFVAASRLRPLRISRRAENPALVILGLQHKKAVRRNKNMVDLRGACAVRQGDIMQCLIDVGGQFSVRFGFDQPFSQPPFAPGGLEPCGKNQQREQPP